MHTLITVLQGFILWCRENPDNGSIVTEETDNERKILADLVSESGELGLQLVHKLIRELHAECQEAGEHSQLYAPSNARYHLTIIHNYACERLNVPIQHGLWY